MSIVLARIDDRFIHGQVTVGWSRVLRPDRIVLCNDDIAADPWSRRIYASSGPPDLEVLVLSLADTRRLLGPPHTDDGGKTILLVGGPQDILALREHGLALPVVNVGGMHHSGGKQPLLDYVYVDRDELAAFARLLEIGVHLRVQSVPGAPVAHLDAAMLDATAARLRA